MFMSCKPDRASLVAQDTEVESLRLHQSRADLREIATKSRLGRQT